VTPPRTRPAAWSSRRHLDLARGRGTRAPTPSSTNCTCAIHHAPVRAGQAGGQVQEFRDTVVALHAAALDVLLNVVFNHTAEAGADGPVLSFRGLHDGAIASSRAARGAPAGRATAGQRWPEDLLAAGPPAPNSMRRRGASAVALALRGGDTLAAGDQLARCPPHATTRPSARCAGLPRGSPVRTRSLAESDPREMLAAFASTSPPPVVIAAAPGRPYPQCSLRPKIRPGNDKTGTQRRPPTPPVEQSGTARRSS
jgi:hypothetical protein